MKAEQQPEPPKPFRHVTLTLESQEEVDVIHALIINCRLRQVLGMDCFFGMTLMPFRSQATARLYDEAVTAVIKP